MFRLKKIDRYILKNFFGTFLLTLSMFMLIVVVFDVSEKLENFIDEKIPLNEIIFTFYLNFIPYFAILYTPLFLFVSVILFTSRLAQRTEFIAMMNSGMTFKRILVPYFIGSFIICGLNIFANNWLVPETNKKRIGFESQYIDYHPASSHGDFHMQIARDEYVFVESFNYPDTTGFKFSFEKFSNGQLLYKIRADRATWNGKEKKWQLKNYVSRTNNGMHEKLTTGKDTLVSYALKPTDFEEEEKTKETMNARELNAAIAKLKLKGADDVAFYQVEKYKRTAFPFAIPILTLIGVSLSSRKVRGGIGLSIGLGIALSFVYIFFQQFSQTFSTKGNLPPIVGVWIPNVLFAIIAIIIYRMARK